MSYQTMTYVLYGPLSVLLLVVGVANFSGVCRAMVSITETIKADGRVASEDIFCLFHYMISALACAVAFGMCLRMLWP